MAARDDAVGAARERADRAAELVRAGAYLVTPGAVLVYSDAAGCPGWTVADGVCGCPDATVGIAARLLDGACKHRMVSELVAALQRSAPERLPPTDADAWLEQQDDRQRAAMRALAEIEEELSA